MRGRTKSDGGLLRITGSLEKRVVAKEARGRIRLNRELRTGVSSTGLFTLIAQDLIEQADSVGRSGRGRQDVCKYMLLASSLASFVSRAIKV